MRKTIFIIIAIIVVLAGIDWVHACSKDRSGKDMFARLLTYADMYEYKDPDFDYVIRVPSFFVKQPDSLKTEKGSMRFEYNDQWINVVIESRVVYNRGHLLRNSCDSIIHTLKATKHKVGRNYVIFSGPQYEQGEVVDGYSYYTKVMENRKLWFVCTMIYPDDYKDVLTRMFKEINSWQIWERQRPELKQGESQTPGYNSLK
ncbi:hypothetical protein PRBRB14_08430 [Hallella multisaccharivorax DSM 17128]|uniref:Uncharacterized protein n=1 Tax=Hallella multisaccharivorax DSM 17128 TaxID=688246 RepID=F8N7T0_9BACT|nr:hypothetical protein [Hallella multisaccharivorax]EGN56435.1 hypothetical protein Premu_0993 [Hallella multisaccharivorax DSM 17128]GJG29964.1 hypothetical protein PRBRB14_08430 [Hallella multisaccharivorax DSM 17128]